MSEARSRCFLVYAIAPEGMTAREANDLLNVYVGEDGRGLIVTHDHFIGAPHGASGGRSRGTAGVSLDGKRAGRTEWDFQSA
jgi:hypothetical protein